MTGPDRPDVTAGDPDAPVEVLIEVTNTVTIDFTSGLQRVVREVVRGLEGPAGAGLEVVPVTAPVEREGLRRLTDAERARLAVHPPGGRAGRRADDFGVWSPVVRRLAEWDAVARLRAARAAWKRRRTPADPTLAALALGEPPPGTVFFDIEASWQNPGARAELLPRLRAGGVHTAVMVADVMPELFPDWFDARLRRLFRSWLTTHLEWTELFLAISERTAEDLRAVAASLGVARDLDVRVVPLGADFPVDEPRPVELPAALGRYLLVVGTLEPRKNQTLVLDAFDELRHRHDDLGVVLVGREGWLVGDLVRRIRTHPEAGRRLLWFGGIDDPELAWLYQHAFLSVCPSRYEGLGVPVMEALHHGCPTISSTRGALPEAGAGLTEDVDPDDVAGLVALVEAHLVDADHHRAARERLAGYTAPTWGDTAAAVAAALADLAGPSARGTRGPTVDLP